MKGVYSPGEKDFLHCPGCGKVKLIYILNKETVDDNGKYYLEERTHKCESCGWKGMIIEM